jgi:serine/threonine-protein kinase
LLLEQIGQGGMATIFKAKDLERAGTLVVVKVLLPAFSGGIGSWSMFQREEEIGARLEHPNIVRFVSLPLDKRRTYLVTEYVPGPTLADRLRGGRPLPEAEALAIAMQLCDALDYMHRQGFVHYDVKPANIIVEPTGRIRLIDLGLAHAASHGHRFWSAAAPAVASADYAAPEQIRRRRGQMSVDVYALGATLYQMLTGSPPFPGDDPFVVASARLIGDPPRLRDLNPSLSPQLEEIVLRALRRNPAERYASAAAMRSELRHPERHVVSGIADRLRPVTRFRRGLRLARYAAVVFVLPVAVQVVLFGLIWWHLTGKR